MEPLGPWAEHRVVLQADWFLKAGTLASFETSSCGGALHKLIVDASTADLTSSGLVLVGQ